MNGLIGTAGEAAAAAPTPPREEASLNAAPNPGPLSPQRLQPRPLANGHPTVLILPCLNLQMKSRKFLLPRVKSSALKAACVAWVPPPRRLVKVQASMLKVGLLQ